MIENCYPNVTFEMRSKRSPTPPAALSSSEHHQSQFIDSSLERSHAPNQEPGSNAFGNLGSEITSPLGPFPCISSTGQTRNERCGSRYLVILWTGSIGVMTRAKDGDCGFPYVSGRSACSKSQVAFPTFLTDSHYHAQSGCFFEGAFRPTMALCIRRAFYHPHTRNWKDSPDYAHMRELWQESGLNMTTCLGY
ncbi:uncharacterized protein BDR25DRAFT_356677 [Lindgomyces ingoldianus]|uniref:Uncharacterized protein n=1 Tax=Lindgomyces ingoldianus TaxID=673940 RepID=A0ACB6QSF3_9PLEO|nr:uncharacterized protein BDR25DRAFT_356677 [Lindgomyces ingoldianus]KAF2469450.1 hypothetical protein BDR25DRAFT_356677 [Lindgomyces ingoldianus]